MLWLHRAHAYLLGYFWTDCPLCDTYFGGHQWSTDPATGLVAQTADGQAICPRCTKAGRGATVLHLDRAPRMTGGTDVRTT